MKTKQPKAFRGHYDISTMDVLCAINRNHELYPDNCTVIPDGAAIPLPADVRRVLRLVMREYRNVLKICNIEHLMDGPKADLLKACEQHQRAEKRRRGGE